MSGEDAYAVGEEVTVQLVGFAAQRGVVTGTPDGGYGLYTVAIDFPVTEHQMRHRTAAATGGAPGQKRAKAKKPSHAAADGAR